MTGKHAAPFEGQPNTFGKVCYIGCCRGCGLCYGYSIGCHLDPCECDRKGRVKQ